MKPSSSPESPGKGEVREREGERGKSLGLS